MQIRTLTPAAALLALAVLPLAAHGSTAAAAEPAATVQAEVGGWTAWHGCWRPIGPDAPLNALVCVVPGETPGAVRMISLEDGAVVEETVMHADGTARPVADGGCTGTETATWSRDGRRVFLRTELDCDGVRRLSTGVIALVAENEWVDVQALEVGGQHAARSMRYRAVRADQTPDAVAGRVATGRGLAQESARLHAAAPLDAADVVEASALVAAPVVEALIALRQHGFGLNARTLVELERQGVPASVLDMMVAVSNPQHFAVQEQPRTAQPAQATALRPGVGFYDECRDPYTFRRLSRLECERLMMYGYGYGSGVRRGGFGYSPWGYDPYGWRYGQNPIVVIVQPEREERQGGQMVRGQGYSPGTGASSTGRAAQPRTEGATATGNAGASATSGNTGSTGTSTGRTAVPRTGGGGDGGGDDERI
jgi:hypothetical protein